MELARKKRHLHLLQKMQQGQALTPGELKELEEYERMPKAGKPTAPTPSSPGICRSQKELGQVFGVTARTVQYWTVEGCPRNADGSYSILAVQQWKAAREHTAQADAEEDEDDELGGHSKEFWEARYRRIKSELARLELDKATGKLLEAEEVEKGRVARITIVRRKLLPIPRQIAPALVGLEPHEIEAALAERLRDICVEFAGEGGRIHHKGHKGHKEATKR
ncbi:MAG TPA: hypothetical protein VM223_15250 [Planctomycetota bacterium]|nr:hypothetical protein [Planctomycetota bacterium]